ncbi:hypothetical protein V7P28_32585, partial [Klebsiella michiganensis]
MPKQVIIPPGTTTPIAPFVPGTLADGVVYVSGTLPFDNALDGFQHVAGLRLWVADINHVVL